MIENVNLTCFNL